MGDLVQLDVRGLVPSVVVELHGVTFCARAAAGFDDDESFSVFGLRWPRPGR